MRHRWYARFRSAHLGASEQLRGNVWRCRLLVSAILAGAVGCSASEGDAGAGRSTAGPDVEPAAAPAVAVADTFSLTVYKSPTCGCCQNWVDTLRAHGFRVIAVDTSDVATVKEAFSVSDMLGSCHTAIVDGYVIEGHVPPADIRRVLRERPAIAGLAVPGMPRGSPGMEGPQRDSYHVLSFDRTGATRVYSSY